MVSSLPHVAFWTGDMGEGLGEHGLYGFLQRHLGIFLLELRGTADRTATRCYFFQYYSFGWGVFRLAFIK